MTDSTKFVNNYVEIAVKHLHDNLNEILQYKTNIKILNDLVSEKDGVINNLTKQLENAKNTNQDVERLKNNAVAWENQYTEMKNKASHVDTLMGQVAEMTRMVQQKDSFIVDLEIKLNEKDVQIRKLESHIELLNTMAPAPSINRRGGKSQAKKVEPVVLPIEKPVTADDF